MGLATLTDGLDLVPNIESPGTSVPPLACRYPHAFTYASTYRDIIKKKSLKARNQCSDKVAISRIDTLMKTVNHQRALWPDAENLQISVWCDGRGWLSTWSSREWSGKRASMKNHLDEIGQQTCQERIFLAGMEWKPHPKCGWGHFMGRSLKWTSLEKVGWAESKEQGCIHVFALDREFLWSAVTSSSTVASRQWWTETGNCELKSSIPPENCFLSRHFIPEAERKQGQTTRSDQQWLCRLRPWLGWP